MEKISINLVTIQQTTLGIENIPVWDNLQSFNKYINSIAQQDDCQMYFPLKAQIYFYNPDGTFKELYLVRLTHPVEIIK